MKRETSKPYILSFDPKNKALTILFFSYCVTCVFLLSFRVENHKGNDDFIKIINPVNDLDAIHIIPTLLTNNSMLSPSFIT